MVCKICHEYGLQTAANSEPLRHEFLHVGYILHAFYLQLSLLYFVVWNITGVWNFYPHKIIGLFSSYSEKLFSALAVQKALFVWCLSLFIFIWTESFTFMKKHFSICTGNHKLFSTKSETDLSVER